MHMLLKTASQARAFGAQIVESLSSQGNAPALELLNTILRERTPFRLLDLVGAQLQQSEPRKADELLDAIAAQGSEGGWVVIASALRERLPASLAPALEAARRYIMQAQVWYACDSLGERVPGEALVAQFQPALDCLAAWRADEDEWVRRATGVAGHFWFKRAHGKSEFKKQARALLEFYSPMLEEHCFNAAKGVGWALKTAGRYYPDVAAGWLEEEWLLKKRQPAAVIRRKALLYLPPEYKKKFMGK